MLCTRTLPRRSLWAVSSSSYSFLSVLPSVEGQRRRNVCCALAGSICIGAARNFRDVNAHASRTVPTSACGRIMISHRSPISPYRLHLWAGRHAAAATQLREQLLGQLSCEIALLHLGRRLELVLDPSDSVGTPQFMPAQLTPHDPNAFLPPCRTMALCPGTVTCDIIKLISTVAACAPSLPHPLPLSRSNTAGR